MLYLDTSAIVAAATRESETERMQAWIAAQPVDRLAISDWVETEFSAALSLKVRHQRISEPEQRGALQLFSQQFAGLTRLPVPPQAFASAARYADRYALGLRSGDALHLGIVDHHGAMLCTLDKRQAEAGASLGIATLLL